MQTAETTNLEQQWIGVLTAEWIFQAVMRAIDPEERERQGIEIGADYSQGEGLWPDLAKVAGLPIQTRAPENLDDLESEAEFRAFDAGKLQAARALVSIRPDRLKALAADLFNEATR